MANAFDDREDPTGATTRWKILLLLCRERLTVEDLAHNLGLTDNAIRAQLQRLERDGYVAKAGSRAGARRPHVEYHLTLDARRLFPTAYELALRALVDGMSRRLPADVTRDLLLDVGRRVLQQQFGTPRGNTPRERLNDAMKQLNGAGAGVEVIDEPGGTLIRTCSCPLASVVAVQPALCSVLAELLSELLGGAVSEVCEKGEAARCAFQLTEK